MQKFLETGTISNRQSVNLDGFYNNLLYKITAYKKSVNKALSEIDYNLIWYNVF